MDTPPAVVVDAHDVCANLEQAQDALREALGGSMAPAPGWRLRVFDERRGAHVIVTANLDDAQGNAVAHREIDSTSADRCAGVISALGVWAGLVLDAEVVKAKAHPAATNATANANANTNANANANANAHPALPVVGGEGLADAGVPAPLKHAIEVGASGTLGNSPLTTGDAAFVGGAAFVLVELARSFFLRPALMGAALIGQTASASYFAGRVDACLRIPGNYVDHRGLLLDACAGTELGAIEHVLIGSINHIVDGMFAVGPTIGLRGDLASALSVEVRGIANFNVAHTGDANSIGLLSMRAELGFTWRLR